MKRVLLLITPSTYRTQAFADAGCAIGLEVLHAVDLPEELAGSWRNVALALDFRHLDRAVEQIVAFAKHTPLDAILNVDDSGALIAAEAANALGLPHNDPEAARAARNKFYMRKRLAAGNVPVPWFRRHTVNDEPATIASELDYPCVVKPIILSGSRGVIRADSPAEFVQAFERLVGILASEGDSDDARTILVEEYLPGTEVALEGLLTDGELQVLALFDKPDPLEGPFFEETIYVTPSNLPQETQTLIARRTQEAARALGLRAGPVHAELRINERDAWLIEMAGRTIGGLCSNVLQFGVDTCLEELVLRHAVGMELPTLAHEGRAAGVMMIPIPHGGILRGVSGVDAAEAVPRIESVEITAKLNYRLVPLPEGKSYLGFIFARGETPAAVEAAIREAHRRLNFDIEKEIPIIQPAMS